MSLITIPLINASDLNCEITPLNECASQNTILKLENMDGTSYNNSHAQLRNYTTDEYSFAICCNASTQELKTDCQDENTIEVLRLNDPTNAHVQFAQTFTTTPEYTYPICLGGTSNITCTTSQTSCSEDFECLASIASSEENEGYNNLTNAHIAACGYYQLNICCSIGFALDIPVLIHPTNGDDLFVNRTPTFNWTEVSDPLGGNISYEFQLFNNSQLINPLYNETVDVNNFTITEPLNFDQYFWRVEASNAETTSGWSNTSNFTLVEHVMIELTTPSMDFGSLSINQEENTTNNSPPPFTFRNTGNIEADLYNISTNNSLWVSDGAELGTEYMQIKARDSSSFNTTSSIIDWINVTTQISNLINKLNYTGNRDVSVDIAITVPSQEPPGTKLTNMTFSWEATQ